MLGDMEETRPNRLTLRFDSHLERAFFERFILATVPQLRFALALVAVVIAAFNLTFPPQASPIGVILQWSPSPLAVAILALTFSRRFIPLVELMVSALIVWYAVMLCQDAFESSTLDVFYLNTFFAFLGIAFGLGFARMRFIYAAPASFIVLVLWVATAIRYAPIPIPEALGGLLGGYAMALAIGYQMESRARRAFVLQQSLDAERAKTEQLLLNILPAPIANRLKSSGDTIADSFDEVSVVFADLVDFTRVSRQFLARDLVAMLNLIFTAFDDLVEKHGLEKIKTIGDAYMAVAGIPIPRADHVEAAAQLALEMLSTLEAINRDNGWNFGMRIGIASGPVVAGVIGRKKFAYDLWGETVNTASRMESEGLPQTIQVTAPTYQRLRRSYDLVARGLVDVKGQGQVLTYLLRGRSAAVGVPREPQEGGC